MRGMRRDPVVAACLLAVAAMLFFPSMVAAAVSDRHVSLAPHMDGISMGRIIDYLEDREGKWGIGDVARGRLSREFSPSRDDSPTFGFTRSAFWGRFRVVNNGEEAIPWYLEIAYPHMDGIDVYLLDDTGRVIDSRKGGDLLPYDTREIGNENFIFSFTTPGGERQNCYVRLKTSGPVNMFLRIWSPGAFRDHASLMNIIYAIYYAAMLIMLCYNLFIFFSLRDRSYLYYVLYCLAFILFEITLNGVGFRYLWPAWPWWSNHSVPFTVFVAAILAVQFLRHFLDSPKSIPEMDRLLRVTAVAAAILASAALFMPYRLMVYLCIVIVLWTAIIVYVAAVRALLRGNRAARLYIITWAAFWICCMIYVLKLFGVLPDTAVTRWMLQASSLGQVLLLSLALADRINIMTERLEALNLKLEEKVFDRTRELDAALRIMEKKDEELMVEFELAGHIQQGILPPTPFYHEGIKVVSYYRAMGKIGGDFYDIFRMKGGYIGILIADASGHGMPAAFITALAKISFSEAVQMSLFPADIFRHVNDELTRTIKTDDFVTAFLVVISPTYDVFYGNASHQRAMVLRTESGGVETWDTDGLFMGFSRDSDRMYEDGLDRLNYRDRLLLYTDGITNAMNRAGGQFGEERLERLLAETSDLPLEEAMELIAERLEEFTGGAPQGDDRTMVMVEIDPAYRDLVEYRDRGFALMWRRRYREAVDQLSRALAINPNDEKSRLYIGECHLKSGDYAPAAEHLARYLENNEFDANVWYNLARAQFGLGEYENAHRNAMKASSLKGNFVRALVVVAFSLKRLGDSRGARETWEKVRSMDPENRTAARELGEE
ncbi:MAG: SpoIIE family protein phosphatase [Spirochaetes bacterium]|nr:SpoIIE family protein phosphatase [Spirochaetota bacterium]